MVTLEVTVVVTSVPAVAAGGIPRNLVEVTSVQVSTVPTFAENRPDGGRVQQQQLGSLDSGSRGRNQRGGQVRCFNCRSVGHVARLCSAVCRHCRRGGASPHASDCPSAPKPETENGGRQRGRVEQGVYSRNNQGQSDDQVETDPSQSQ